MQTNCKLVMLLGIALLCFEQKILFAQTAGGNVSAQAITNRLSGLSTFLDNHTKSLTTNEKSLRAAVDKQNRGDTFSVRRTAESNTTKNILLTQQLDLVSGDRAQIIAFAEELTRVRSEIVSLPLSEAVQHLQGITVPTRVQELLVLAPNGSKLPPAPHMEISGAMTKAVAIEPYVVGPGGAATVDYPSVANITYSWAGMGHSTICTGTLVAGDAILTAAHCFCDFASARTAAKCSTATYLRGQERLRPIDPKYFGVFFQDRGSVEIKEVIINPKYDWPKKDLAIIRLSSSVAGIVPAPLNDIGPVRSGSFLTIVGFGVHSDLNSTNRQAVAQPIMSSQGLKLWATTKIATCVGPKATQELICWNYQPRMADAVLGSTCHGDSGGPLFAKINGQWRLAGVTSGGANDCTYSAQAQEQSFDVDVFKSRDWIKATANISGPIVASPNDLAKAPARAYGVPYHLFVNQPDKWASQFYLPANLKSVIVSVNATPTFSKLSLELVAPNAPPGATPACKNNSDDSTVTCIIDRPAQGTWTASVTGSRPQESQIVAAVTN